MYPQTSHATGAAESAAPAPGKPSADAQPGCDGKTDESGGGLNRILQQVGRLTSQMSGQMNSAFTDIERINNQTKMLALNARIEAARAGTAGQAFAVAASEMGALANTTKQTAKQLNTETRGVLDAIVHTVESLGAEIRGTRLSDMAMTNIDVIDRNLYERSCDVRWWATDGSVVDALTQRTDAAFRFASQRLGVILDSYTVYYDIVLCDLDGKVVANGRPERYASQGTNQRETEWFRAALACRDGTEFGFQSVHRNPTLANGQFVLVYSCTVREGGNTRGPTLGVLGIVFNWESLAQTIVKNTQLSAEEKPFSRVCVVDGQGLVLADTDNRLLAETLPLPRREELFALKKGHLTAPWQGAPHIFAHAASPGYETYATGWHSIILQRLALRA